MRRLTLVVLACLIAACGSDGGSPTAPSSPTPAASTYSLSGRVSLVGGGSGIGAATIRVADGPNANQSTTSDGSGNYSISGLSQAGFTVNVSAPGYDSVSRGVTLTGNRTENFSLYPSTRWRQTGTGDNVFDMPSYVTRVRITGTYTRSSSSNFVVYIGGRLIVNELVGSHWGQTTFTGTYQVTPGTVEIKLSSGVDWILEEQR